MLRFIIIAITAIVLPQLCNAQKLKKSFEMLEKGDTIAAQKSFEKNLKKHIEPYAAYYGIAMCQTKTKPKQAFTNLKKVDVKFHNSGRDFKKYMKNTYNITPQIVKTNMDEIAASQLRRTIEKDSTERGFSAYIRTYKGCSKQYTDRAFKLQEDAAYREARKDNTLKKAKQFTYDYPQSHRLNFIIEYIDSVEYFSRLHNGTRKTLLKYITDYEKGRLFSLVGEYSMKKSYYEQAYKLYNYLLPTETLTDDYVNKWRSDVYYSGHWSRLRFFYDRLPHLMNDSMKQMYYASLYGEMQFGMQEELSYYGQCTEDYYLHKDSIYDFYIRRGAPSNLALRKVQELYKDYLNQGKYDSVIAVINRYEPFFECRKYEIEELKKLLIEKKDSCRRIKLPPPINGPYLCEPIIKYRNIGGKKIPYVANRNEFSEFNMYDSPNKYPVISPDGKRLYMTHWKYVTLNLKRKEEYIHKPSQERYVFEHTDKYSAPEGVGICYSDLKNGSWQKLVIIDSLYCKTNIRVDTLDYLRKNDVRLDNWRFVPENVALKIYNDKKINAKPTDLIKYYVVYEDVSRDKVSVTSTGGVSADNSMLYTISPKNLIFFNPKPPHLQRSISSKVIKQTTNLGGDRYTEQKMCGNINYYFESDPDRNPHPFFGSFNPHPTPQNNVLFFAANRKGVPAWREGFEVPNIILRCMTVSAERYASMFYPPNFLPEPQPTYYTDIWFSTRDENGNWSYPTNAGLDINTEYGEYSPVLAADNKTLYFISNGRLGMGGTDIYMSKRLKENSWKEWSVPVNLGRYINTPNDEHDFSITADGKTAYYTSEEPITHRQIIYKVELPMAFRPDTIAIYKGKTTNLKGEPVGASIKVIDLKNEKTYTVYRSQMPSGEFYFGLPQDRPYKFVVTSINAVAQTDTMNCDRLMQIVKNKDFVLVDSSEIFVERLLIPIPTNNPTDRDAMFNFLRRGKINSVEIIATEPTKSEAEDSAEYLKSRFRNIGVDIDNIKVTTKIGKKKADFRILD